MLDLILRRHSRGHVHIAGVLVAENLLHLPVRVRRRPYLDEVGRDRGNFTGRRDVPYRARIPEPDRVTVRLQLAVLVYRELEELAVRTVGSAI